MLPLFRALVEQTHAILRPALALLTNARAGTIPVVSRRAVIAKDLISTTIAAAVVAVAGMLTYRLASLHFGPIGFGEYALVRRTLAAALPAVMVGVGVALPRQIAMEAGRDVHDDALAAIRFLVAALVIVATAVIVVSVVVAVAPGVAARLFFGEERYRVLLPVVGASLGALCAQATCYGYLRGLLRIRLANVFLVCSLGASPLLAFVIGTNVVSVLWANALLLYALATTCIIAILVAQRSRATYSARAFRSLLAYGLPRVPGDFALAALMSFPSIMAAHVASVKTAGIVAFGTTLLTLTGTAVSPLSTVMLPHSAALIRDGKWHALRDSIARALPLFAVVALFGTLVLEMLAGWIVRHFLGEAFVSEVDSVRWMVAGVGPYAVFVALRSINDGFYAKAVNAWNCYAALLSCAISSAVLYFGPQRDHAGEIGFVASMWLLAALTGWRALTAKEGEVIPGREA